MQSFGIPPRRTAARLSRSDSRISNFDILFFNFLLDFRLDNLAALVITAGGTGGMRHAGIAAIGALGESPIFQGQMRTSPAAGAAGSVCSGNSHNSNKKIIDEGRIIITKKAPVIKLPTTQPFLIPK